MAQPSAVSVTRFARKQMASFSLCWHVLIAMARALLCVIIHVRVTVAACLAGLLKISFCGVSHTWRIFLRISPIPFYG